MSMFKCKKCSYQSFVKADILKKHYPIHHKNLEPECEKIQVDIICEYCNKNFSTKATLSRHLHTCKNKIRDDENKLKEKIEELEKIVNASKTPITTTNNTNSNNTTTNNTTNNTQINNNYITISLTPYNDPNMEGMQQYLEAAIRKTFLSVPNLIESVHFNKEYPENHNICITNRRTKDARVFDGKKWKTINKDLLINEIVDTYERELTSYAEEKGKTKYIKNYESAMKRGNAEKDLIDEVHNVIYDNSEKVNTKVKEVQKPVKQITESEQQSESETSVDGNISEAFEDQPDSDSGYDSDSVSDFS